MPDDPLKDAIWGAEDNVRRACNLAQAVAMLVEGIHEGKLLRSPENDALLAVVYDVLDTTRAVEGEWERVFDLVNDNRPGLRVAAGGEAPS